MLAKRESDLQAWHFQGITDSTKDNEQHGVDWDVQSRKKLVESNSSGGLTSPTRAELCNHLAIIYTRDLPYSHGIDDVPGNNPPYLAFRRLGSLRRVPFLRLERDLDYRDYWHRQRSIVKKKGKKGYWPSRATKYDEADRGFDCRYLSLESVEQWNTSHIAAAHVRNVDKVAEAICQVQNESPVSTSMYTHLLCFQSAVWSSLWPYHTSPKRSGHPNLPSYW